MVENIKQNQVPDTAVKRDASGLNGNFQPKALLTDGIRQDNRKITLREFRDIIRENANYKEKFLFESSQSDFKDQFAKRKLPEPDEKEFTELENLKYDGDEVTLWVEVKGRDRMLGNDTDIFSVRMEGGRLSVYGGSNALSAAIDHLRFMKKTELLTEELAKSFSMILNRIINSDERANQKGACLANFLCVVYNENFDIRIMPLLTKLAGKIAGGGLQLCYHFISPQMGYPTFPQALPLYERLVDLTTREMDPNDPIWAGQYMDGARKAAPTQEAIELMWIILGGSDPRSFPIIMRILDNVPDEALVAASATSNKIYGGSKGKTILYQDIEELNRKIKDLDERRPGWEQLVDYKAMGEWISRIGRFSFYVDHYLPKTP